MAAGRGHGDGGGALRAGDGIGATRHVGDGDGNVGRIAGVRRALRLPLALGCRRVWRLGYRRGAWWAGTGLGAVTVASSLLAGLLGPLAIAVYAAVISLPVWIAWVVVGARLASSRTLARWCCHG